MLLRFCIAFLLGLLMQSLLAGCSAPRAARDLPLPPPVPTEASAARGLPEGVSLEVAGRSISLDELREGKIPQDSTVTVIAVPTVSAETIFEMLKQVHDLGYLVHFPAGQ